MSHRILVLTCSSDTGRKIMSSQSLAPRMDTRETPACDAADATALQRTWRHMCLSNKENFPYPRRDVCSTDWSMLPIITQKTEMSHTLHPASILRLSTLQISLNIDRAKINNGMRINVKLNEEEDPVNPSFHQMQE